jgi:hypothetical protein
VNEGYLEIADLLVPEDMSKRSIEAANAKLAACRKKVGDVAYFRAVSGGQYIHPDGMYYGGGPSWSSGHCWPAAWSALNSFLLASAIGGRFDVKVGGVQGNPASLGRIAHQLSRLSCTAPIIATPPVLSKPARFPGRRGHAVKLRLVRRPLWQS